MCTLDIIYRDEYLVAVNKPHGLLVHPSPLARDATDFAMQMLRDQLGQYVYPSHRIDRKTGGVLLFALNEEVNRQVQHLFSQRAVHKKYFAIVRGYTDDAGEINYPLKKENGTMQEAFTKYKTLGRAELEVPLGRHETSRYSLVEVMPETGRMHQIRKHFDHIRHPILGDRAHGCNKQNRMFKERWGMTTMLLHASTLSFPHPVHSSKVAIFAPAQAEFIRMGKMMHWNNELMC